jgi:uncharacterized protein (DUF2461 family)
MAAAKVVAYFGEEFLDFFSALSRNNKREWFHAHKKRYEQHVKKPFEAFVGEMIHRIGSVDPAIAIQPREAIFRIARDTSWLLLSHPGGVAICSTRVSIFNLAQPGG